MPFLKHKAPCTTARGIIEVELHMIAAYETQVCTLIPVMMYRSNYPNVSQVLVFICVF